MSLKQLTPDQYYQAYAFFVASRTKRQEAMIFEQFFEQIIGEGTILSDMLYDTSPINKDQFTEKLTEMGFEVEWKPKEKKNVDMPKV